MECRSHDPDEALDGFFAVLALAPAFVTHQPDPSGLVEPPGQLGQEERSLLLGQAGTLGDIPPQLDSAGGAVDVLPTRAPRRRGVKRQLPPGNGECRGDFDKAI